MKGPAGTSITYVQNLCSDFIAAGGGQIVIPQHFSCQQSNLTLCQIPFFCFFRLMISCYISFLFIVISESVISDSVIAISFFLLYQIPFHQILLYQFPFFGYISFRYIRVRYINFPFLLHQIPLYQFPEKMLHQIPLYQILLYQLPHPLIETFLT